MATIQFSILFTYEKVIKKSAWNDPTGFRLVSSQNLLKGNTGARNFVRECTLKKILAGNHRNPAGSFKAVRPEISYTGARNVLMFQAKKKQILAQQPFLVRASPFVISRQIGFFYEVGLSDQCPQPL
jgi:hypothetical protein